MFRQPLLIIGVFICVSVYAEPSITFSPSSINGLEMITDRSRFGQELGSSPDIDPAVRSSPLLRYCYFLRNLTGRYVVTYSTRWTRTTASGLTRSFDATWWNLDVTRGGDDIAPGAIRLVAPLYRFGQRWAMNGMVQSEKLNEFLADHDSAAAVVVSLEAVIFDDGSAFGPDRGDAIDQVRGTLDARQQLSTGFVNQMNKRVGRDQLLLWIDGIAKAPREVIGSLAYSNTLSSSKRSLAAFLRERLKSGADATEMAADLEKYLRLQKLVTIVRGEKSD